jgi:hypothetical protein
LKPGSITFCQGPIGCSVWIGPEWIWMQPRLPTKSMKGMPAAATASSAAFTLSGASGRAKGAPAIR